MKYGYARISSKDQNMARQIVALKNFGVNQIFEDRESGKNFERKQYQRLLKKCKKGDVIVIKSIDRLGRNYNEIIEQWRQITKIKETDIVVLDMPLLDTRENSGDITGAFISDIVLQILSYVADIERQFIKQRQAEGIIIAKSKGVKFGRPEKEAPKGFAAAKESYLKKEISSWEACKRCGVPHTTFLRWVKTNKK